MHQIVGLQERIRLSSQSLIALDGSCCRGAHRFEVASDKQGHILQQLYLLQCLVGVAREIQRGRLDLCSRGETALDINLEPFHEVIQLVDHRFSCV